jgi:tetratricopeptide (TPR) repeat protein
MTNRALLQGHGPGQARPLMRRFAWAVGLLLLLLLPGGSALGIPVNKLRARVADLKSDADLLAVRYKTQASSKQQLAEHRLVDAQVLYTLKDYTRAAILLLDYIEKYKNTRGYPEALFFLADSLYHKRDFLSAKRYFARVANQVRGKYYQESLQRLVELSLRTGDYSDVQQYLTALASIPPNMLKPSVPYVQGKYYYFRKQMDQAISTFRSIPQGHKYYMHSQYFTGAALVQKKDLAAAAQVFQALLRTGPKTSGEKHIRDLAYLAVGRLLYEKNEINKAIDMYQKLSRRSPEFDTALFEIAWAYIKAKQYKKALRALDLLVLAQPDSPMVPEVKVLQGNLLMRLEKWGRATDLFTKAREKFVPVQNRMKQIMTEHSNPNVFFDVLLAGNLGKLETTIQVPKLAVHWVNEQPKVKRALNLVKDMRNIQQSIKDAEKLIKRLERAINSPAKIKIFPEFASAKAQSLEVENKLLMVRKAILGAEADLVGPVASGTERSQMRELAAKRLGLEDRVKELPKDADGYKDREKTKLTHLNRLEKSLQELSVLVESLNAQLVAAKKFFMDTAPSKSKAVQQSFKKESEAIEVMLVGLGAEVDEIRTALTDAKTNVGVGGADEVAERNVKKDYLDALAKEHALLLSLRARLSGAKGAEFDALSGLFGRCDRIEGTLKQFDDRLDKGVEGKLTSIRAALAEEKQHVGRYTVEASTYKAQTDTVAGGITYVGFQKVAKRFYEIVVRADVGIIDVAWALKDAKSKEVSRLVRQQKMDLKVLDAEFKEVLKED